MRTLSLAEGSYLGRAPRSPKESAKHMGSQTERKDREEKRGYSKEERPPQFS